jgi:hypothetical protein
LFQLYIYFLFSKKRKTLCDRFVPLWKNHFFTHTRILFSYFIFLSPNMISLRKQNIPQDAAWKALQFIKNSLFHFCIFYVQKHSKFCAIGFRSDKSCSHRVWVFLKTKSIQLKWTLVCRLWSFSRCILWYILFFE